MNFELSAFFSFSLAPTQPAPTPAGPSPGQAWQVPFSFSSLCVPGLIPAGSLKDATSPT